MDKKESPRNEITAKWEYKILSHHGTGGLQDLINEYAQEGWKPVNKAISTSNTACLMKKKLK